MSIKDDSFTPQAGLEYAVELLHQTFTDTQNLPDDCPHSGIGGLETLKLLAPHVLGRATYLDKSDALAHMDPPTPWITWAMALWNARLNQNLLHRATSPFATDAEKLIIEWLTPFYGMDGGHMCSGSTLANLTGLWAAREAGGVKKVIASSASHLSIKKAAHILGLPYQEIPINRQGQIDVSKLTDISDACLVLTAGTTTTGVIDCLSLAGQAKWTHVDAAWAGALRLSPAHSHLLDGIEKADSVAISAHKWFYQPKESALILFKETARVNPAISFGGSYLASPNVGLQGSRGAAGVTLLATLIAWGTSGLVSRIDDAMSMASHLADALDKEDGITLWAKPTTAVNVFKASNSATQALYEKLPQGMFSTCTLDNEMWIRSVAANPIADIDAILDSINEAID